MQKTLQPKLILAAILAAYTAPQFAMAEEVEKITTEKVEVISTTPLLYLLRLYLALVCRYIKFQQIYNMLHLKKLIIKLAYRLRIT